MLTLNIYNVALSTADPVSKAQEISELSIMSIEDPLDPANLSIGHSEVSLSNLDLEAELQKVINPPQPDNKDDVPRLSDLIPRNTSFPTSTPSPDTPFLSFATSGSSSVSVDEPREGSPQLHAPSQSHASPVPTPSGSHTSRPASPLGSMLQRSSGSPTGFNMRRRSDSPLNLSSRPSGSPALWSASPSMRTGSPLREIASAQELQSDRMPRSRISREDVQMRLMRKRSMESPLGSPAPSSPAPPAELPTTQSTGGGTSDGQNTPAPNVGGSDREREGQLGMASSAMDISAEFATIQTAEKRVVGSATVNTQGQEGAAHDEAGTTDVDILPAAEDDNLSPIEPSIAESLQPQSTLARPQSSFSLLETSFDLSGGLGLRDSMGSIQLGEMRSALDRLMDDVKGSVGSSTKKPNGRSQVRVELVREGMKAGQLSVDTSSNIGDDSMQTETDMDLSTDDFRNAPIMGPARAGPLPIQRAATDSVVYTGPSFRSPVDDAPPPTSPTKDAIRTREQLILQKRRQARRRDEEESESYYTPPRPMSIPPSSGRPSRRRSRSTGDAGALRKSDLLLDIGLSDAEEELLADSISKELRRLDPEHRPGVSCF